MIEFLANKLASGTDLDNCNAKQLLKLVKQNYWNLYSAKEGKSAQYYNLIASACLSRVKLTLGSTLSDVSSLVKVTVSKLFG